MLSTTAAAAAAQPPQQQPAAGPGKVLPETTATTMVPLPPVQFCNITLKSDNGTSTMRWPVYEFDNVAQMEAYLFQTGVDMKDLSDTLAARIGIEFLDYFARKDQSVEPKAGLLLGGSATPDGMRSVYYTEETQPFLLTSLVGFVRECREHGLNSGPAVSEMREYRIRQTQHHQQKPAAVSLPAAAVAAAASTAPPPADAKTAAANHQQQAQNKTTTKDNSTTAVLAASATPTGGNEGEDAGVVTGNNGQKHQTTTVAATVPPRGEEGAKTLTSDASNNAATTAAKSTNEGGSNKSSDSTQDGQDKASSNLTNTASAVSTLEGTTKEPNAATAPRLTDKASTATQTPATHSAAAQTNEQSKQTSPVKAVNRVSLQGGDDAAAAASVKAAPSASTSSTVASSTTRPGRPSRRATSGSVKKTQAHRAGSTHTKKKPPPPPPPPPQAMTPLARETKAVNDAETYGPVKRLLEKAGFVFRGMLFCRPGMDPEKNPQAKLGEDYFNNKNSFREHLCAYGVGVDSDFWTDEEQDMITEWVRRSIVRSKIPLSRPEDSDLGTTRAVRLLKSIGFKYQNFFPFDLCYHAPRAEGEKPALGRNVFLDGAAAKSHSAPDLWSFLARFGLPSNCDFDRIGKPDLLSLELFLTEPDPSEFDTFERWEFPQENEEHTTRANKSTARRSKRKAANDQSLTGTGDTDGVARKISYSKSNKKGRTAKNTPATKMTSASQATADSTISHSPIGPTSRSSAATVVSLSPPEPERSVLEKLTNALTELHPSTKREIHPFEANGSHFNGNLQAVAGFIDSVIESNAMHGGQLGDGAALLVCGAPGIGKTSGVLWCCNRAIAGFNDRPAEDDTMDEVERPILCHVNAVALQTSNNPTEQLFQQIGSALDMKSNKLNKRTIESGLKRNKTTAILVVDEVDQLVNGSGNKPSSNEKVVEQLTAWANDPKSPVALIGICNSMGNSRYERLNEVGRFKETITFKPYEEADIVEIIRSRIGESVVELKALTFIAKKVCAASGDIRKAFEMTASAVKTCLKSLPERQLTAPASGPVVKFAHAHITARKMETAVSKRIDGLPTMGKVALCVIVTLAQAELKTTTLGHLKKFVKECMQKDHEDEMYSLEDFATLMETLIDSGLLQAGRVVTTSFEGLSYSELQSMPILFGTQLQEVENALKNELASTEFYSRLRQYAEAHRGSI